MLLKELVSYYGIRWYWILILYLLVVFNRVLEMFYPALTLSAKENINTVSEASLDILLKGTFIGLIFYFLPDKLGITKAEKLKRSVSLGFVIWFILFQ
jgi:hypothetical protein